MSRNRAVHIRVNEPRQSYYLCSPCQFEVTYRYAQQRDVVSQINRQRKHYGGCSWLRKLFRRQKKRRVAAQESEWIRDLTREGIESNPGP